MRLFINIADHLWNYSIVLFTRLTQSNPWFSDEYITSISSCLTCFWPHHLKTNSLLVSRETLLFIKWINAETKFQSMNHKLVWADLAHRFFLKIGHLGTDDAIVGCLNAFLQLICNNLNIVKNFKIVCGLKMDEEVFFLQISNCIFIALEGSWRFKRKLLNVVCGL